MPTEEEEAEDWSKGMEGVEPEVGLLAWSEELNSLVSGKMVWIGWWWAHIYGVVCSGRLNGIHEQKGYRDCTINWSRYGCDWT